MNDPYTATMILDTVKFGSKANAGKGEVKLTFSSREYPELNQLLIAQAGNPVDVSFTSVQGALTLVARAARAATDATSSDASESDTEEATIEVDGQPAKLRRPRNNRALNGNGNGNGHHDETDIPFSYHAFADTEETPGLCTVCRQRAEDAAHKPAPWAAEDKPLPHAFRRQGRDWRCGWCYLAEDNELHEGSVEADPDSPIPGVVESFEDEGPSVIEALTDSLLAGIET